MTMSARLNVNTAAEINSVPLKVTAKAASNFFTFLVTLSTLSISDSHAFSSGGIAGALILLVFLRFACVKIVAKLHERQPAAANDKAGRVKLAADIDKSASIEIVKIDKKDSQDKYITIKKDVLPAYVHQHFPYE